MEDTFVDRVTTLIVVVFAALLIYAVAHEAFSSPGHVPLINRSDVSGPGPLGP